MNKITGSKDLVDRAKRQLITGEHGYVTVEMALSLLSLVLIFSLILAGMSYGVAKIQSCNSLRVVSRAVSLGKSLPELDTSQSVKIFDRGEYAEVVVFQSSLLARLKVAPPVSCKVIVIPEPKKEVGTF